MNKKLINALITIALMVMMCACGNSVPAQAPASTSDADSNVAVEAKDTTSAESTSSTEASLAKETTEANSAGSGADAAAPVEKNGQVVVLCTSDVHCGVNQNFGYAGLAQIRQSLENQGYTTILIDDGDSIQGEALGTLTGGEADVRLMNLVGYDVVIPGNHEFDYGMDQFLKLVDMADYTYISCNITKNGELLFDPYKIIEACGMKIAFVGVTTPESLNSSSPKNFQDEAGNMIYGFCEDEDGTGVYEAIQKAVDAARAEGADYVYLMGHMGLEATAEPWTYYDVITHTTGIDVFFDGHSHDTVQDVMKNKDGKEVIRSAVGTKMSSIGYSYISPDGIGETNIWGWPNSVDAPTLLSIDNEVATAVSKELEALQDELEKKVCDISFDLIDKDPYEKELSGQPIRLIRFMETNLSDVCADAIRDSAGADIAFINGGCLRGGIKKGSVTYGDIFAVFPFSNTICVIKATGQQILDALEWGARGVPGEEGAFLHPSGLTYEIDSTIDNPCKGNEFGLMTSISGPRRVSNVLVDGKPIDLAATYTIAGIDFTLLENGDGFTSFDGCEVVNPEVCLDNVALIDYMKKIAEDGSIDNYTEIYGQDRIVIKE